MSKKAQLEYIRSLFLQGQNMVQFLDQQSDANTDDERNRLENISISYDIQAGGYIRHHLQNPEARSGFGAAVAKQLVTLGPFDSILEAGIGEATTFGSVLRFLPQLPQSMFGFDIAWSRVKYAQYFLERIADIRGVQLCVGDLFQMPFAQQSVDVAYTCHALEPNYGREKEALTELLRISKKYVVMLEPAYELADEPARRHMEKHKYIQNLYGAAKEIGCKVIEHRLFDAYTNPLNPTGLLILDAAKHNRGLREQEPTAEQAAFACPITYSPLQRGADALYSVKGLLSYPLIQGIPCLTAEHAIVTTKYQKLLQLFSE